MLVVSFFLSFFFFSSVSMMSRFWMPYDQIRQIRVDVLMNERQSDAQIHRYIGHRFQRVTIVSLKYNFNFKKNETNETDSIFSVNNFSLLIFFLLFVFEPGVT